MRVTECGKEAWSEAASVSDEAGGPRREHPGTGSARPKAGAGPLLEAALTRDNLKLVWKRVKANKDAADVGGHDIKQMAALLANVLLDEVDKALQARGHCFARCADDCNVYVGSMAQVVQRLRPYLPGRRTSGWRKHPRSGVSWKSGCATNCEHSSSSIGNDRRRCTASSRSLAREKRLQDGWRPTAAAGGATAIA